MKWPTFHLTDRLLKGQLMRVSAKERQFIKAADRLHKAIDRAFSYDNCPFSMEEAQELEFYRDAAAHLRWSYPIGYEYRIVTQEDRLETLFSAPLFTSQAYPWPTDKKGNPLEPICQIDLRIPSELSGLVLGDGVLQLWMDGVDGRLRLIPRQEVEADNLTSVPACAQEYVWPLSKGFRLFKKSDPWREGYVMTAVYQPVLTVPESLVPAYENYSRDVPGKRLSMAFDAMEEALQHEEIVCQGAGELGFFGNFSNIQYREIECPETLMIMESGAPNGIFLWGGSGNAQIFYELSKEGAVEFSFSWSCN
jgi:hypothetical protein